MISGVGETLAVRLPRQARTRAAWQRILEAGVQIIERDGYDALTIASLCERAGVTPPTIYARAGSKEALMLAIYEHAMERIRRSDRLDPSDARWQELPADMVIAEAVTALAQIWLSNARLLRALVTRSGKDPETFTRGSENSIDLAHRFTAILLSRPDLILGREPELRADACFRVVYAALVQRVMFGAAFESDRSLPDEQLQAVLIEMVQRFLTTKEQR
jgi:AcrR family transcriptional regulator